MKIEKMITYIRSGTTVHMILLLKLCFLYIYIFFCEGNTEIQSRLPIFDL